MPAGLPTTAASSGRKPDRRLAGRFPEVAPEELIASLAPPARFDSVRFATYVPNPDEPTQDRALREGTAFAARVSSSAATANAPWWRRLLRRQRRGYQPRGLYFDGGFGVGKTHLLASLWHEVPHPKAYGTFVELTNLVGVLGFAEAVERLSGHRLLAIDEFELDDPGDTMLVTRLLRELIARGVHVAVTSNTLPDKLGEGRFAAEDFLREIRALSESFDVVRVEGPDYRNRGLIEAPHPVDDAVLEESAATWDGATVDDFGALCEHLARLHPSTYGRLLDGVTAVHVRGLRPVGDQSVALRLVTLVDRLYDRAIPVLASGEPLSSVFPEEMMRGGYRKKYLRAVSRLTALARDTPP